MIDSFDGDYAFLSNFYPCPVSYNGLSFICSEGAYQAQKCFYAKDKSLFCNLTGGKAKRLGRTVTIRPDFDDIKYGIMENILFEKFMNNPHLALRLKDTGCDELIEGNTWKDTFWGYDFNLEMGENNLGKILMYIRCAL